MSSGRESPDSAASDTTPVRNNAASSKQKKGDLHSLWEYRATSLKGSPEAPKRLATPRVVSPVATERRSVKKEAQKFEANKPKSEDELTLLKKELEILQGKNIQKSNDTPLQKKKNAYLFWEQKSEAEDVSKLNSINQNGSPKSERMKGNDSADLAGALTIASAGSAFTATAASGGTSEDTNGVDCPADTDTAQKGQFITPQLMSEFRAFVEDLVRKVMPSEIDHIDELIEEYKGREEELLEVLSVMQAEVSQVESTKEDRSAATATTMTETAAVAAVNVSQNNPPGLDNVSSFSSEMQVFEDDVAPSFEIKEVREEYEPLGDASVKSDVNTSNKSSNSNAAIDGADENAGSVECDSVVSKATTDIGIVVVSSSDIPNSDIEEGYVVAKSNSATCCKRKKVAFLTLAIILILAGAGAAIGIILSSRSKKSNDVAFDKPIGTGRPLPEKESDPSSEVMPGFSPDEEPGVSPDEESLSLFCTSGGSYNTLSLQPGIGQLIPNNPLVAVDGLNAIIVTGSGYVSFYSLQDTTWQRGETFGILASHGRISSVSISGDTAVIGLPQAAIAVGSNGPVKTGMIVTYERNPETSRWRQAKEMVPDEYQGGALRYQDADFGQSVSIYDDLLVVGAPSEETNVGSVTVFKRDENGSWVQVAKLSREAGTCQESADIFFGYSVNVHKNTIAVSADCAENIAVYEYFMTDDKVKSSQVLEWIDRKFGAVASVAMNDEYLIYSTVGGGLFIFSRKGDSDFVLSQELTFNNKLGLFEYPVAISNNLFVISVGNKFQLYSQAELGDEWKKEPVTLVSDGDFNAYVKPGLSVSNGQVLVGSNTNIEAYDLSQCVPEIELPDPETELPDVATPDVVICVVVNVTLDNYPVDTTWRLDDSDGNVVASNSPYDESMATTTQIEEVCDISDGDYTFSIFDDYGDGQCCKWGLGGYILSTEDGLTIASGGEFGASEKTSFSIPFVGDSTASKPSPTNQTEALPLQPSPVPTTMMPNATADINTTDVSITSTPTDASFTSTPTPAPSARASFQTTQAPVQLTCVAIEITLNLDDYPQDTSWNIVNSTGGAVAQSPPYDASMAGSRQSESLCLPAGSYSFDIYDVYEDSMCCLWGEGNYTLTSADGDILAAGGEWLGPSETKTFQL